MSFDNLAHNSWKFVILCYQNDVVAKNTRLKMKGKSRTSSDMMNVEAAAKQHHDGMTEHQRTT